MADILKEKIINLRKKGFSFNKIKKELGCAKSTISYHLKNEKIEIPKKDFLHDVEEEIINKVIQLRLEKKTYKEILNEIEISEDKLIKIGKLLGISFIYREKKVDKEKIINFYQQCCSQRKTAKEFGISRDLLKKVIEGLPKIKRKKNKTTSESVIDWRKRTKIKLVEHKGGCCQSCGYKKCIKALEFHHLDPTDKDFTISSKSYSFERMKNEVNKCVLVCSNCHVEIHEEILETGESKIVNEILKTVE